MPLVSLVVPVLEDAAAVARLSTHLPPNPLVEMLLVDGGSDAELERVVGSRSDVQLIRTTAGRGNQMNRGAEASAGEWILFLHADSQLPEGWLRSIVGLAPSVVGGWFRFALDDDAWQARWIERAVAWRVRLFRLPYGDQGIFVRRAVFERLGGYRELPIMEDVEFVRRLVRAGPVSEIPLPLLTDSRRWRRDGWFRRSTQNLTLLSLYFAGVSPSRLARWY